MSFTENPIGGDIAYTESFCNLSSKRNRTLELFFEAYGANRLLAVSEPLVTLYEHQSPKMPIDTLSIKHGLLISIGYRYCLVIPIINGQADFANSKRVNVGTYDSFNLMSKSFSLKYEHLGTKIDFPTLKVVQL